MIARAFLLLLFSAAVTLAAPVRDDRGVSFPTADGVTRVEVWGAKIVRIVHRPANASDGPSLAVIGQPAADPWTFADEMIGTEALKVSVDAAGKVTIRDAQGGELLRETGAFHARAEQSFALDPAEAIIGLGQHQSGVMNYAGTSVHLQQQNTEVAVSVLLSSKGYAVLWDNPSITDVDIGKTDKGQLTWTSENGQQADYYFCYGPEPDQAIAGYRALTGAAPMLGRWAWGLWQSRERYKSQQELLDVAGEYRRRGLPLDGIIQIGAIGIRRRGVRMSSTRRGIPTRSR